LKTRDARYECLRILAMVFIIVHHIALHTNAGEIFSYSENAFLLQYLASFGKVGVALFMMISGFFMIRKPMQTKKVLNIVGLAIFYQLFFHFLYILQEGLGFWSLPQELLKNILELSQYWFIQAYVILFLFSGFLNRGFRALSKKEFLRLIGLFFLLFSLFQFFIPMLKNQIATLLLPYMIGAYLQLYPLKAKNKKKFLAGFWICSFLLWGSIFFMQHLPKGAFLRNELHYPNIFSINNSPFVVFIAVFLFLYAQNLSMIPEKASKIINSISPFMLAVYIIHENVWFRSELLEKKLYHFSDFHSPFLVIQILFYTAVVSIVSVGIEKIRYFIKKKIVDTLKTARE
jgi:surface polysaccharide O-acyltransferase-like enzyme